MRQHKRRPGSLKFTVILWLLPALLSGCTSEKAPEQGLTAARNVIPAELCTYDYNFPELPESDVLPAEFTITLSFTGDNLLSTDHHQNYSWSFLETARREPADYFYKEVASVFEASDFTIANLENVISDRNLSPVTKPGDVAYWFKSPVSTTEILKAGNIDVVTIANNHTFDFGAEGYTDTKNALDAADILWCSNEQIAYVEKEGFRIAVIGVDMWNLSFLDNVTKLLAEAEEQSDYQIIYYHGGTESVYEVDEWRREASRTLIDLGADLVIGAHPHRIQPMESYKDATILYSLGNFLFGGNKKPVKESVIYQETLTITDGTVTAKETSLIPCHCYSGEQNNWQPYVLPAGEEKDLILEFMRGNRELPF